MIHRRFPSSPVFDFETRALMNSTYLTNGNLTSFRVATVQDALTHGSVDSRLGHLGLDHEGRLHHHHSQ